jgi:hypothetical protein
MLDIKDKRIEIVFILILLIFFVTYYFYPKDDYVMEMVKPTRPQIEKVEEVKETIKKSPVSLSKTEIEEKVKEEKQIIERGKILFSSTDSLGKYEIQLINNIDMEIKNKNMTRYVPITGEINDGIDTHDFSISISEDYLNHLGDLKVKIVDNSNEKRVIETLGYFLGALDINSSYNIKLNISGDTLDAEIKSSEKMPDYMIEEVSKDEPFVINTEEHNKNIQNEEGKAEN